MGTQFRGVGQELTGRGAEGEEEGPGYYGRASRQQECTEVHSLRYCRERANRDEAGYKCHGCRGEGLGRDREAS